MKTLKTFSGATSTVKKSSKFDWEPVSDGKIYVAVQGEDFETAKGFIVSMSRYANENEFTVVKRLNDNGSIEFSLTPKVAA